MTTKHILVTSLLLCITLAGYAEKKTKSGKTVTKPVTAIARPLNPISPPGLYIADPEPRVMPDGPIIGTCRIQPQPGDVAYAFHSTAVTDVSGVHALVMVFKSDQPEHKDQNLMNLEWFQFE